MPPSRISFTASRSPRAAARATPLTNFVAFPDPATLWIRSRSLRRSRIAKTQSSSLVGATFGASAFTGLLFFVAFGFAVVGNLIAAPFNGLLAEAVEMKLRGHPMDSGGGWKKLAKDFFASLASEVRKLVYFLVRAVPLLVLMLIPGVNVIATALWLVLSAWMLAVEYADYPMANHGLTFPRQRKLLAGRRFLTLGFGGAMTVVLMVPFLNFLLIPAGVAGATAMWVDQLSHAAAEEKA